MGAPAIKRHVKKHTHWYWLVIYVTFFIGIPLAAAIFSKPASYYVRIFQTASFWLIAMCFGLYALFAPKQAHFRKKKEEFTRGHEITIMILKIFYVVWVAVSIYLLAPVLNGVFQKFILDKPYEIIDDTVIYAHSTGGRYSHSDGNCIYMFCQLKLQRDPSREFEYDDAPYIQQGNRYEFVILPGSNLIVGNSE